MSTPTKTINDGGPAFPIETQKDSEGWIQRYGSDGMSLRDYFAAHAPAEPGWWFDPVMDTEKPDDYADTAAIRSWEDRRNRERWIQWPYAWADLQIAQRSGTR